MWLSVRSGSSAGRTLEVTHGFVIGRDPGCDLAFPEDPKISRRHAYVNLSPDGSVNLQDLGSTNGSFVDGQRISGTVQLSGNEHLRFGDTLVDCLGEPSSSGSDPQIGGTVGRYAIKGLIAEGSMGLVYLAEHARTGRTVALKLMNAKLFGSERARERFLKESRAAGAIEHPNIIPIYDADEVDGIPYIAMRWIRGEDLNTIITVEGALLPPDRAISIVEQIGSALDAAHTHGLVHRDVKPGNILVTSAEDPEGEGRAYLGDFGITKDLTDDRGMTVPGNIVGTRDYMAPEQFMGEPVDARTDVYALGCVLFEALTGVRPYGSTSEVALMRSHLEAPPPEPHRIRPELPEAIDSVIAKALAKRKEDRYGSCVDMTNDARTALTSPASSAPGPPLSSDAEPGTPPPPTIVEAGGSQAATALEAVPHETVIEVAAGTILESSVATKAEVPSSTATIIDTEEPVNKVAALHGARRKRLFGVGAIAAALLIGGVVIRAMGSDSAKPAEGQAAASISESLPSVPGTPARPSVVIVGPYLVAISWPSVSDALRYSVLVDGVAQATTDTTSWTDNVVPGDRRTYAVVALNEAGPSVPSDDLRVAVPVPPRIDAHLGGIFRVTITQTSSYNFNHLGTLHREFEFQPYCQRGPCGGDLRISYLPAVRGPIRRQDSSYVASLTAGAATTCNAQPVEGDIVALNVRVMEARVLDGVWRATRISGVMRVTVSDAASSCSAFGYIATIDGRLRGA